MSWLSTIGAILAVAVPKRSMPMDTPRELRGARVGYASEGRCGRVVFTQGIRSLDLYYEFGGGDTVAIIDVPGEREWAMKTGFPLAMRGQILEFIGRTVARDQVSGGRGRFEIQEGHILILSAAEPLKA